MSEQSYTVERLGLTLSVTKEKLSLYPWLEELVRLLKELKLTQQANKLFPKLGNYRSSVVLNTLILMLNEGGSCLEDIKHLHTEKHLLKRLGISKVPDADSLRSWLEQQGEAGIASLQQINRTVIDCTLQLLNTSRVTLDLDARTMFRNKAGSQWAYFNRQACTPIVGTLAESGQVVAMEFRPSNLPPSHDNLGFIKLCGAQLPQEVQLERVRTDAAGYQRKIIEYLNNEKIEFVIRASMDDSVKKLIAAMKEEQWQPLRLGDEELSDHEWTARRTHIMNTGNTPFNLVIQRSLKSKDSDLPLQPELPGLLPELQFELEQYLYRLIASNLNGLDDSQVVDLYNQRSEHSKKRINELKSDFSARRPPCNSLAANILYVNLCALAYNVFILFRTTFPPEFRFTRASIVRPWLYNLPKRRDDTWQDDARQDDTWQDDTF